MTYSASNISQNQLALGDILTIRDGGPMTVRALIQLQLPIGTTAGFVVLGEFELALALPALQSIPASVCIPRDRSALEGKSVQVVAEGATRYWPPHRPAVPGAMTAVKFRVINVRGEDAPVLVCFRGPEPVVFSRSHTSWMQDIAATKMGAGDACDGEALQKQTGEVVVDPTRPVVPVPSRQPAREAPVFS